MTAGLYLTVTTYAARHIGLVVWLQIVCGELQVREYMDRMVKADGEASKAHADANKAQKALRQLETDVDALRCSQHLKSSIHHVASQRPLEG